jgi:hypothetical protein
LGALIALPALPSAQAATFSVSNAVPAGLAASTTWNGRDLSEASSVGSAFVFGANDRAQVNFSFSAPQYELSVITTARLVVYYFGAAISANSVATSTTGSKGVALMNWSLSSYTFLFQGVYRLTASLVDGNGTTAWSESFYLDVQAPYRLVSGITLFLIVLGGVEIWSIVTSARTPGRRPPKPWKPPAEPAPAPTAESAPPEPTPSPSGPGSPEGEEP